MDNSANGSRNNYQVRVRNSPHNKVYLLQTFPSLGVAGESGNQTFILPKDALEDIPNDPRSWETSLEVRVAARAGSSILYETTIRYDLRHPSADLSQFDFSNPVGPTNPPGNYPANFTDARPTGAAGFYRYEIYRQVTGSPGTYYVGGLTHGIYGAAIPEKDHPSVNSSVSLPVVSGEQVFWIQPQASFKNSAGTSLGQYDIAPKSPDLMVETTEAP